MGIFAAHARFQWFIRLGFLAVGFVVSVGILAHTNHGIPAAPVSLDHALQLADLNNWIEAEPAFRKAAELSSKNGDRRGLLFAQLGMIRSSASHRNLLEAVAQLDDLLAKEPLLQSDRRLRLFCMTIRGDLDGEMKSAAMRPDWNKLRLWRKKWATRSGRIVLVLSWASLPFTRGIFPRARKKCSVRC